ncbi:MAG: NAD(P)/FAD-dependent oxidoreductase [Chitinophagales bacterium]
MGKLHQGDFYDVVVIGSGIGGLTAGAILSRSGLRVAVMERSDTEGGYLMGFTRNRFTFDTAIHWLNQCRPCGMVHTIFESLGTDFPEVRVQSRIKRYIGDDYDYLLTADPDQLKQRLQSDFPEDKSGIERFFRDAKILGNQMHRYGAQIRSFETMRWWEKAQAGLGAFRFVLPFLKHVRFAGKEGVQRGLKRYFSNPKLRSLFASERDLLSCLIPIGWAYFGDFQNPPTGGSQTFAGWLAHLIESYGNDVFYYADVKKVLVENQEVQGVVVNQRGNEYTIKSRYVIAACDLEILYRQLLPQQPGTNALLDKLQQAELYDSSLTIHVALNKPAADLGFNEEMIFITRQDVAYEDQTGGDPEKSELLVLSPSFRDPTMAPEGKGAITIFMPALWEHHQCWKTEVDERGNRIRGAAYNEFKEKVAQILVKRVGAKLGIDLAAHIEFYEVATPITHWRYSGNKWGSMMGTRPGKINYQLGVAGYRTPVKNLFIGGHWAELGGGVPIAAKAGLNAALCVLREANSEAFKAYVRYLNGAITATEIRNHPVFKPYISPWIRRKTPAELLAERRKGAD